MEVAKKKTKKQQESSFRPANAEQEEAIKHIQAFIDDGNPDEFFTLMGKAGTGKTTIIQEAIAPYVKKKTIIIAALSHKAKLVLASKVFDRFGRIRLTDETIASMLGMKMDPETGKFELGKGMSMVPPIAEADIVIVDECSMVNEEAMENIFSKKPFHCKVIFLGDIGQLPPIRDDKNFYDKDLPSPSFRTYNKATLKTRVRQGEESPILPYADHFWNNSQSDFPELSPVPDNRRESMVTEKGSLVFSKANEAISSILPLYKKAVETGNMDIVRIVVYKNNTRHIINNRVRSYLFGDDAFRQFVAGDLVIFYDNYDDGEDMISNSTEFQVKHVKETETSDEWQIFELGVSINGRPKQLPVLRREEQKRFEIEMNKLANRAKGLPFGPMRSAAWKDFYSLKERFAPVEYAYGITSHKAQGSTYDVSVVAEADIMQVQATTPKSKSQSIYTAITRARHLAIILDGQTDHPEALQESIELLKILTES